MHKRYENVTLKFIWCVQHTMYTSFLLSTCTMLHVKWFTCTSNNLYNNIWTTDNILDLFEGIQMYTS